MSRAGLGVGAIASSAAPGGGGGGVGGGIVARTPIQVYDETPTGNRTWTTTGKGVTAGDFIELYYFNESSTTSWVDITGWTTKTNVNIGGWGQFVTAVRNTPATSSEADGGATHAIVASLGASSNAIAAVIACYGGVTALDQAPATPLGGSSDFVDPSVINLPGYTTVSANSYYTLACPVRSGSPAWDTAAAVAAGYTVLAAFTTGTTCNFFLCGKAQASAGHVQAATTVTSAGTQYEYATAIGKV